MPDFTPFLPECDSPGCGRPRTGPYGAVPGRVESFPLAESQ